MFRINYNIQLKNYNTFRVDATAKELFLCENQNQLTEFIDAGKTKNKNILFLGAGSNILFTKDFDGLIIKMINENIEIISSDNEYTYIQADAGVEWDNFVQFCCENNFYGAENLSLIPGTVGAAPVQNIGAYGTEAKDIIETVYVTDIFSGYKINLSNHDCNFAYRNSIFKSENFKKYIITSVIFKLKNKPDYKLEYGNLKEELKQFETLNLLNIRQAVINIRQSKLPDYKQIPNAGSFFKNPEIDKRYFEILINKFPYLISYPAPQNKVKLAAGQLIEKSGLKGFILNNAATHQNQALVIINTGNATGNEIKFFSEHIKKIVFDKYGIMLQPEVIFI